MSILVELLNVIFGSGYIYGKCASELINDNLRISREAQIGQDIPRQQWLECMAFGVQIEKNKFENILGAKMPFYHNGCGCNSRFLHTAVAQIAAAEGWTYFDILKHDKILRGIARPIVSNTSWHTQEILKSFIMLEEKDTRVTNLLTKYFTEQIGYTYDERTFRCGNKSDNDYYLFNKTSGDIPSFPHQTAILYADNTFQNLLAELKEKRLSLLKNRPP